MKNNNELNYFNETRKQELDKMIADFSDEGCMICSRNLTLVSVAVMTAATAE